MLTSASSTACRKRVRYTLDVHFSSQEEKETFVRRVKSVRDLLTPAGHPHVDNHGLMSALFDAVEGISSRSIQNTGRTDTTCFLSNSGKNCRGIFHSV